MRHWVGWFLLSLMLMLCVNTQKASATAGHYYPMPAIEGFSSTDYSDLDASLSFHIDLQMGQWFYHSEFNTFFVNRSELAPPLLDMSPRVYSEHEFPEFVSADYNVAGGEMRYDYDSNMPSRTSGTLCSSNPCDIPIDYRCGTTQINLIVYDSTQESRVVTFEYDFLQIPPAAPVADPEGYVFLKDSPAFMVGMSWDDKSQLYFSLDGNYPVGLGTLVPDDENTTSANVGFTNWLNFSQSTTLRMAACRNVCAEDAACSDETVFDYQCQVRSPWLSDSGGYFSQAFDLNFGTNGANEFIKYTTDGSDPMIYGAEVESYGMINISETTRVRLVAYDSVCLNSVELDETYIVDLNPVINPPVISLPSGIYYLEDQESITVTWDEGTSLWYNWSDSPPEVGQSGHSEFGGTSGSRTLYLPLQCGPVSLSLITSLGYYTPVVTSENQTFHYEMAVYPPDISPEPGQYYTSVEMIVNNTDGTIYYTTDGSDPEYSSNVMTSGLTFENHTDLRAKREYNGCFSTEEFQGSYEVINYNWHPMVEEALTPSYVWASSIATDEDSGMIAIATSLTATPHYGNLYLFDAMTGEWETDIPTYSSASSNHVNVQIFNGQPVVIYRESNVGNMKIYSNGYWSTFAFNGYFHGDNVNDFSTAVYNDPVSGESTLFIAYVNDDINRLFVKSYSDSGGWHDHGVVVLSAAETYATKVRVAVDSGYPGGAPIVAYTKQNGYGDYGEFIYVKMYKDNTVITLDPMEITNVDFTDEPYRYGIDLEVVSFENEEPIVFLSFIKNKNVVIYNQNNEPEDWNLQWEVFAVKDVGTNDPWGILKNQNRERQGYNNYYMSDIQYLVTEWGEIFYHQSSSPSVTTSIVRVGVYNVAANQWYNDLLCYFMPPPCPTVNNPVMSNGEAIAMSASASGMHMARMGDYLILIYRDAHQDHRLMVAYFGNAVQ